MQTRNVCPFEINLRFFGVYGENAICESMLHADKVGYMLKI